MKTRRCQELEAPDTIESKTSRELVISCASLMLMRFLRRRRRVTTGADRKRLIELQQENRELRRANEILRRTVTFYSRSGFDKRQNL